MASPMLLLAYALVLLAYFSVTSAEIVEHSFHVQNLTLSRLCKQQVVTAVNGSLPGPAIQVHEGDTLIIHVFNKSPYNLTIHWHGIFQLHSAWADGPEYVTQCPILPGNKYTYKFTITGQEGTLWWHAHSQWLRATVHGALIIRPRKSYSYPFPKPFEEFPILLGEWWNANIIDVENQALADGHGPNISDAFTINGWPGDLYNCSSTGTYKLKVVQGETYLLRIINVALNNEIFFKIANHTMTVVAVDACYTNPMVTDVIVITPGQTIDVLLTADQPPASYYMAAHAYDSLGADFDKTTTRGIITYGNAASSTAPMPTLPAFNDTPLAFKLYSSLTSLVNGPHWAPVPLKVDNYMFVTEGLSVVPCEANNTCGAPFGLAFAASLNNESFELPTKLSMLEAFYYNLTAGIYTADFPSYPPVAFDYTSLSNKLNVTLMMTSRSTRVTKLKFNSTVQIVFQNTALLGQQSHPIHLHGFNFYVLAQGFGNYDPITGSKMFNLINPQIRNTVGVPVGGWTVIRFTANNPGVWLMHCHFDSHLTWGLATAFVVEDGPTPSTSLPPPPPDLPICSFYAKQRRFFIKGGGNAETVFINVKTLVHKKIAFVWSGSWPGFLLPCFIVFVWLSYTMCKVRYSSGLKL
ncbi:laccase-7-like [Rhododendron vialii]|uniref:laccase-7-like n=1 Tax=Rhododendron vialii TaxID=182163 RepID=UPI00265D8BAB|nr:laccase-7-like [Rhododendron vialii]